jgi:1,2-diacylglycerol 3-alpha-glucosyltransferase
MNILIGTDTYYPDVNGTSYFTQRLAFSLKERGHSILVIAPSRRFKHELYSHKGVNILGIRSIPVLAYKNFRISPPLFIKNRIEHALLEFTPDVVHVQGHIFLGRVVLSVAQELNLPSIGTNHFMPENLLHYFPLPKTMKASLRRWAWRRFCAIFEHVDIVTTPTKTAAGLLQENGLTQSIYPISCGIDRKRFHPRNSGEYLRKRYALPDHNILLYVGRLDKEKHLDFILDALSLVPEQIRPHFVIVGIGCEERHLKQLVHKLLLTNDVTFTGFIPDQDLPNLYCLAACFIIAGTAELQSLVTMEAMASGLPVIAVQAMALPELVRHGQNGYLFQPDDKVGLANQIMSLFSDESLRKAMASRSLEIIAHHDSDKILNQFESLYEELRHNTH